MRDDGHMQGGGCHDRRRRNHTGRRRDSTDGHRERPSSRAFAIRRENGGRDFRMLPAALTAWMASAAAHQWWRWLTLMDDDPMSVTGYAIGALAVMLLPVALVVPSLAAHGLIRPLRASLGDAVAVMAVAGLLSAAAAVTDEVSFTAVPANRQNPSLVMPIASPSVGKMSAAKTLNRKKTEMAWATSWSLALMTGAVAAIAEPPQMDDPTPMSVAVRLGTCSV